MIALSLGDDQVSSQRHCAYAEDNASSDKERSGREIAWVLANLVFSFFLVFSLWNGNVRRVLAVHMEKPALEVMSLEAESRMRITQYNDEGCSQQSTATNNGSGRRARRLFWDKGSCCRSSEP